eukprot:gene20210-22186_t
MGNNGFNKEMFGWQNTMLMIIAISVLILNLVEVVITLRKQIKLKPYERLMLSLALSDVLVTLQIIVFKSLNAIFDNPVWTSRINFTICLLVSISFSISNICAITIDRFLAVRFPIKHRILTTPKRVKIFIVIMWFLNLSSASMWCLMIFVFKMDPMLLCYTASVSIIAFGVLMLALYFYIMHVSMRRKLLITAQSNGDGSIGINPSSLSHKQQVRLLFFSDGYQNERHIFYTCSLVTISYVVCSFPYAFNVITKGVASEISMTVQFVLFLNSGLNPLVYFFKGLLTKQARRQ